MVLNPVRAMLVQDPSEWRWSSYRAAEGRENPHPCLFLEGVWGHFGAEQTSPQMEYRQFVREGIGQQSIWDQVKGQSLLGQEGFADHVLGYVKNSEKAQKIAREQRYLGRPQLKDLFSKEILAEKKRRDDRTRKAVERYGYSQREVADHLGLHYSTISRMVNEGNEKDWGMRKGSP